jgi:hypothetical protein
VANLKTRLAILEASLPAPQEPKFIFFTRAERTNDEITGFKYKELNIVRVPGEALEDIKTRSSLLLIQNYPIQANFFIQSIYSED